eukprot:904047-Amphidinium_carterae.1
MIGAIVICIDVLLRIETAFLASPWFPALSERMSGTQLNGSLLAYQLCFIEQLNFTKHRQIILLLRYTGSEPREKQWILVCSAFWLSSSNCCKRTYKSIQLGRRDVRLSRFR